MQPDDSEIIEIEVTNWEKYQSYETKRVKRPHWFAMSNHLLLDHEIQTLTPEEFKCWMAVLCEASIQNSYRIRVMPDYFSRKYCIRTVTLHRTILKASKFKWIALSPQVLRAKCGLQDSTIQNRTEQNKKTYVDSRESTRFPIQIFEKIYQEYPRKEGKTSGIVRAREQCRSKQSILELLFAVRKYKSLCEQNGTERQYIKLFSSFVGTKSNPVWRDYLDPDVGTGGKAERTWQDIANERGL